MEVKLGQKCTSFPSKELEEAEPCNALLDNPEALREELNEKGYLLVRNFHNRDDVLKARHTVLEHIDKQGTHILDTNKHLLEEAVLNQNCGLGCVPFMEGRNDITHCQDLLRVLEGSHAYKFFKNLFEEDALTFDFKWLRAMHSTGFTGAHIDRVYMSRGSQNLLTLWTPFGDIPPNMGVLAVCEGSHKLQDGFKMFHDTYGKCDLEAENISGTGWFTEDPDEISRLGGKWKTAHFHAGDAIIFNMRLVHMSTANLTNFLRISCDTRWQPRSHNADPRYVGKFETTKPSFGVYGTKTVSNEDKDKMQTISTMKKQWGYVGA